MYPEFIVPPEERKAFLVDRKGAIVGRSSPTSTAGRWATPSRSRGMIYPGHGDIRLRGIYAA